ncbi:MAG: hypothetical protein BYD32DRAFT_416534 [Podila humilis]|nr:MAG: hypothetical protein BYD32DRAFT_416534 [Podila humilis]
MKVCSIAVVLVVLGAVQALPIAPAGSPDLDKRTNPWDAPYTGGANNTVTQTNPWDKRNSS